MSRILVLNKYRCQHVEPFRLGQEEVSLLRDYVYYDQESGNRCFDANSIQCHECSLSADGVTRGKTIDQLEEENSRRCVVPQDLDLYRWYLYLTEKRRGETRGNERSRLLQLWAGDVVYFFELPEIERFFRHVCAAHDMVDKAELSVAFTGALTTKTIGQRPRFWRDLKDAFQMPNMRRRPAYHGAAESECSRIIRSVIAQLEGEMKLLRLLTCDYPMDLTIPLSVEEARDKMSEHEPAITDTIDALQKVLDSSQTLNLDTNDLSQHSEVINAVGTGRWLTIALYQLYARQKSIMWQLAMKR